MTYYNLAKAEIGELTFVDTPHEEVALDDLREAQKDESNPTLVLYRIGPGEGDYEPTHVLIDEVIYRLVEVVEIDPAELSKALEGYSIPSGLESHIHNFLRDHKFLLELLFRIREQLPVYFPGAQYQLSPGDDYLSITVVAGANCREQLEAFDNGWWIDNVHFAKGCIIIDAEEGEPAAVATVERIGDAIVMSSPLGQNWSLGFHPETELIEIFKLWNQTHADEDDNADFGVRLSTFIRQYGETGIQAVKERLESESDIDVIGDVLYHLGWLSDPLTAQSRRELVKAYLTSNSPRVRYYAVQALTMLNPADAESLIREAMATETDPIVKSFMQQMLDRLAPAVDTVTRRRVTLKEAGQLARTIHSEIIERENEARENESRTLGESED